LPSDVDRRPSSSSSSSSPSSPGPRVTLVAAYADNRVIGDHGGIPWHLPEDFAHFKATTMGGVLVMGRSTYESIGRPLPGRDTIVLTRNPDWSAEGVLAAHSLPDALDLAAARPGETYVVGGSEVYERALPLATHQVLTEVHGSPAGDAHYPDFDVAEWVETRREPREGFDWVWWERR